MKNCIHLFSVAVAWQAVLSLCAFSLVGFLDQNEARAEREGEDVLVIPIRWCVIEGSPAHLNPELMRADNTDFVMWNRFERWADRFFLEAANVTFRSAMVREIRDSDVASFPIINDPCDPTEDSSCVGEQGDLVFASGDTSDEVNAAFAACEMAWDELEEEFDVNIEGILALNARQFVRSDGSVSSFRGVGGCRIMPGPGEVCVSIGAGDSTPATFNTDCILLLEDNSFSPFDAFTEEDRLKHDITAVQAAGSTMFLGRGNGTDGDGDVVFHSFCDADEPEGAFPTTPMNGNGFPFTDLQGSLIRSIASVTSGTVVDPPSVLLPGVLVGDHRPDPFGDVDDSSIDIMTVGIAQNTDEALTLVSHRLAGLIPQPPNHAYTLLVDIDDDSATGGDPSQLGIPTAFQGAELVTRVVYTQADGPLELTGTIWRFEGGEFVEESGDIVPSVSFANVGPLGFHVVSVQIPNSKLGAGISAIMTIQAVAENLDTGGIDRVPAGDADGAPLRAGTPNYPVCGGTPGIVRQGETFLLEAIGLRQNRAISVLIGDEVVAQGTTDGNGEVAMNVTVGTDISTGRRVLTISDGDALSADCVLDVQCGVGLCGTGALGALPLALFGLLFLKGFRSNLMK